MVAYMANPKGELLKYLPDSANKKGDIIAHDLYFDYGHPYWKNLFKNILKDPYPLRL